MLLAQTNSALTILLELAGVYGDGVLSLGEISSRHNIPLAELSLVLPRLKSAKLVSSRGKEKWLYLAQSPEQITVRKVMDIFEPPFSGVYLDEQTGDLCSHKSNMGVFLKLEREKFVSVLYRHYGRVTLFDWVEKIEGVKHQKYI